MGYKRGILGILILVLAHHIRAQSTVFRFPLDTLPLLSGTFGEFRGTHFHAGIDIKTYGKTGLPVYATADGYVSRIKISPYGYGKAIYLTHDNGFTSVYGHLSGFNAELEAYIRKHQYDKKSYSIELFPGKSHFKLKQGDIIAFSGNTGGSNAPHLHFELRDSRTQEILDPLGYSMPVPDTIPPHLSAFRLVSRDRPYKWNNGHYPSVRNVYTNSDTFFQVRVPPGKYGIILAARDYLTADTSNLLGVHSVKIEVDGEELYYRKSARFSFRDSRYIHLISSFEQDLPPLEHCFKEPWIKHALASYSNDGWFVVNAEFPKRDLKITLSDAYAQKRTVTLSVAMDPGHFDYIRPESDPDCSEMLIYEQGYSFNLGKGKHIIDFFKKSFFDTLNIRACYSPGPVDTISIMPHDEYVSERFRIVYGLPDKLPALARQLCLAREGNNGAEYAGGDANDGQLHCYTRNMGKYYLSMDTIAPGIEFQSLNNDTLLLIMGDDFSGIAKCTPRIDGRWFLMEYDPKTRQLFGVLSEFPKGSKLELVILIKDNRGNSTTYKRTIQL